ncbi:hypothetical protein BDW02DRAFT_652037 [Decorospora gaudefroyi]|uniref:DUF6594 domain-containing protein n=1 Tax=Decorospora gaudefroyi TaxID=184978 RepID=A0A6A5JX22_9PLEO|nr:hypothetical protein BDW02DRAFT_652037 [Decorospora gaudefroyi]
MPDSKSKGRSTMVFGSLPLLWMPQKRHDRDKIVVTRAKKEDAQYLNHKDLSEQNSPGAPPKYARGYPRVAAFMACGGNLAIFRKFDRMAYGSILHQQNQLLDIEKEIDEMDSCDEDLINLVPNLRRYVSSGSPAQQPAPHVTGLSRGTVDDFFRVHWHKATFSDTDPIQASDQIKFGRWVEIIFKSTFGGTRPHVVLRGPWDYRQPGSRTVAFSIIFISEDQNRDPCVIWEESLNSAHYPLAASWEFEVADTSAPEVRQVPLQTRSSIGDRFEYHMGNYLSRLTSALKDGITVRLFLEYRIPEGRTLKHPALAFWVCSATSGMTVKQVLSLSMEDFGVCRAEKVVDQSWDMNSDQGVETLRRMLEHFAKSRNKVLKDSSLLAKSVRREDIVRADALDRLERKLAAYSTFQNRPHPLRTLNFDKIPVALG